MTFSVNTKALIGLPLALDRRSADLSTMISYLVDNTNIGTFGLMNLFHVHQQVVGGIVEYLSHLQSMFADPDADRVRDVIVSYATADLRASGRSDAVVAGMPGFPHNLPVVPPLTKAEYSYGPAVFDDRRTPTASLVRPSNHYSDYAYQPSMLDVVSPTSIGRDVIWKVSSALASAGVLNHPIDPLEEFVRPIVGDWAGLLRSAEVFDHLGAALTATASCVTDSVDVLPTVWTGNVAGACTINLQYFAINVSSGVLPLAELAASYRQVAKGVQANANYIETVLTNLSDLAIELSLADAGGLVVALYEVADETRDFVKSLALAFSIINNIHDVVSDAISNVTSVRNKFGILNAIRTVPMIFDPVGVPSIPMPPVLPPAPPRAKIHRPRGRPVTK